MRSGKPDFRVFGQVTSSDPAGLAALGHTLPLDAWSVAGHRLDIEYAGRFLDVEEFLAAAATAMLPGDEGHLDIFDDEAGRLTRMTLACGGHTSKSHRYDDILEHTKGEGNW